MTTLKTPITRYLLAALLLFTFQLPNIECQAKNLETSQQPNHPRGHRGKGKFDPNKHFQRLQAYITKEAGLTQDEAARYFPIFKETREQERKIHQAIRKKIHASQRAGLSEKESEKLLAEIQELSLSEAKLKNANIKKWRKVLSASKVLKVLKAESDFNRQTFREFSKR